MESGALFLVKLSYYSWRILFYFCIFENNWILVDILADYFLPTNACFIQIKNTLIHIVEYEKTIFDKKK